MAEYNLDSKSEFWVRNEADVKRLKCISRFCKDGSYAHKYYYCGVGKCNMFGCACQGGCRQNTGLSYQEMGKIWREEHGLSFKAKRQK